MHRYFHANCCSIIGLRRLPDTMTPNGAPLFHRDQDPTSGFPSLARSFDTRSNGSAGAYIVMVDDFYNVCNIVPKLSIYTSS